MKGYSDHHCTERIMYAWVKRRQIVSREIVRTHATAFPSRLGSVAFEILRRNSVTSTLLGEISEYAASRYDNSPVNPPLLEPLAPEVDGNVYDEN